MDTKKTEIKLNKEKTVHFAGIGGISMSSLAQILLSRGYKVSGSDIKSSSLTEKLKELGARVYIGQSADNISDEVGTVVYTAAVSEDNEELKRARELGIPLMTRAEFLGMLMREYENVICVSGTHGKTTTTSILSQIFLEAGRDPTILSGGIVPYIGGNTRIGGMKDMISEACEYTNSFLSFCPKIAIILNVRADHLDFFKDIDDIRASFRKFAALLPPDGTLIINGETENVGYFTEGLPCAVVTYGLFGDFDYTAGDISYDSFGRGSYRLFKNGVFAGSVSLKITGEHNISNSLAAAAAADVCGIPLPDICAFMGDFEGVERRFEYKGSVGGVTVIDDYAHHPDEIRATLAAAKRYPHRKLWVVFQPHTYTRTLALLDEFAEALKMADAVVLPDIYPAREEDIYGVSSDDLRRKAELLGVECYYLPTFDEVEEFLLENCIDGDLLITMGAGNVGEIGDFLLGK